MTEEIVYYSYLNKEGQEHSALYGQEPSLVKKGFSANRDAKELRVLKCPSFQEFMHNVYEVASTHNLDIDVFDDCINTKTLGHEFFDNVSVHSAKEKMYGFDSQAVMFVAKSDSLEITQESPFMSDTDWSSSVNVIPGKLDAGKYFRPLTCSFDIHKNVSNFKVKEGEPLYYVRFHTNKKIKFVPFLWTDSIDNITKDFRFHGEHFHTWKPLNFYYDVLQKKKYKNLLLKEIKISLLK